MVKCKICKKQFTDIDYLIAHIEKDHSSQIPEDYTAARYEYYLRTGKTSGSCVVCKNSTGWNEHTNKYHRFCKNPKCKEEYRETFKKRMIDKHGKVHLLNDPEQQRKMIYNKKTSGRYEWSDGSVVIQYASSYELDFLQMIDLFMNHPGDDIMGPSPHTYYYKYNGETKFYIPDFYIPSLNLEIEIKDGGTNPNNHAKIQAVDKVKEKLKDETMLKLKDSINYLKVVNMEYGEFFKVFLKLREKDFSFKGEQKTTIVPITESVNSLYIPKGPSLFQGVTSYNTALELLNTVKTCKFRQLGNIERDVNAMVNYLDSIINSKNTEERHRMIDEAKKEKEILTTRVLPAITRKRSQVVKITEIDNNNNKFTPDTIVVENELDPNKRMYRPVYILLTFTGTKFSKLIKGVTHQPYSHASISFDPTLTNLYSFGRKESGDKLHFINEDITSGLLKDVASTTKFSLYAFMATEKQYNGIQQALDKIKEKANDYRYNTLGLITNFLGIEIERDHSYFCSEFVADLLNKADPSLLTKHPSLFTPSDLRNLPSTIFINKGTLSKYNAKTSEEHLREKLNERGLLDVNSGK